MAFSCYTLFRPLSQPVSILIGSVPGRQIVHIEQGTRSHRNWQAVHIDAGLPFTSTRVNVLVVHFVHIKNCTLVGAEKRTLSGGERAKRKSLDFSKLLRVGGRNRTRTCDPIDVNDVLSALVTFVQEKDGFPDRLQSR